MKQHIEQMSIQANTDAHIEEQLRAFFNNTDTPTPSAGLRTRTLERARAELTWTNKEVSIASPYFKHLGFFANNLTRSHISSFADSLAALVLIVGGAWSLSRGAPSQEDIALPLHAPEQLTGEATAQSHNAEIDSQINSLAIEETLDDDTSLPDNHHNGEQFELDVDQM